MPDTAGAVTAILTWSSTLQKCPIYFTWLEFLPTVRRSVTFKNTLRGALSGMWSCDRTIQCPSSRLRLEQANSLLCLG